MPQEGEVTLKLGGGLQLLIVVARNYSGAFRFTQFIIQLI